MKRNAVLVFLALAVSAFSAPQENPAATVAHVYFRFDHLEVLPKPFLDAGPAVLAAVKKEGLNPEMYFVQVRVGSPEAHLLLFDLWDVRAFPLDPFSVGNPGGECRTVEYDTAKKSVTRIFGWR